MQCVTYKSIKIPNPPWKFTIIFISLLLEATRSYDPCTMGDTGLRP